MRDAPRTLYDKIWDRHVIAEKFGAALIYIDCHLLHEGSRNAFVMLRERGGSVLRPQRTYAFADHLIPVRGQPTTTDGIANPHSRTMASAQVANCGEFGIRLYGLGDPDQGIVHVVGPEQGLTHPGMTIVCGDSHTSTHGAFAALAFGIGATEVAHVLATQTLWQRRSSTMRIDFRGQLGPGVTAKDLVLALIGRLGANGGSGYVLEYAGPVIERLSMEERMTICNMSVEAGARAGLVAVDDTTIQFLDGRAGVPRGQAWEAAVAHWRTLRSDPGAEFDAEHAIDCTDLQPTVTWGTTPADIAPIGGRVPAPAEFHDADRRSQVEASLAYMALTPGMAIADIAVDRVFIGSCTNGRMSDLREVARLLRDRKVVIPTMIVPGSSRVRAEAEAEGLAAIFAGAGCEWLGSGCSMCLGMNGDIGAPGERCVSTSNRNFRGRQGPGVRTHLVSPLVAAATAVTGKLTDPSTCI